MQATLIADRSIFESALAESSRVGVDVPLHGLHAPIDAKFLGILEEAWESVSSLLEAAFNAVTEGTEEIRQAALVVLDKVLAESGNRTADLTAALRERLRAYVAHLIDGMLHLVRPTIEIAGLTLQVSELNVSQKVLLGGSLKVALIEAIAITSSGEFMIDATYRKV